jgi:hypothetical protein
MSVVAHHAERARLIFTKGFPTSDPVVLVEMGYRTVGEWVDLLRKENEFEEAQISTLKRQTCGFSDDTSWRYKALLALCDGAIHTTAEIHLKVVKHGKIALVHLRKLLKRMAESCQIDETYRMIGGLEVTSWTITTRGYRELNAHLARVEEQGYTSASIKGGSR